MAVLIFRAEPIATMRDEVEALFALHYEEIAEDKDALQVDVEWEIYEVLERNGKLILIAARCGAALVGYFVGIIGRHPHYRKTTIANEDVHFLHRDYRRGLNGKKLIAAAMTEARGRGAEYMIGREKIAHPHSAIWKCLGFRPIDTCYIAKL